MTINKIHSAYAALALAVLLAPACQREDDTQPQRGSVSFTVMTVDASLTKSPHPAPALIPVTGTDEYFLIREETALQPGLHPADAPATKAAIYPEGALQKGAELGLVAYAYTADSAPASTWKVITKPAVTPLILDDSGTGGNRTDGSGKWIPSPSSRLEWPREGFVRYFAYVPYSAVSGTFADNGAPVLDYSVPEAVASQVDLLVSTPESTRQYSGDPGWRNIDVPMVLQHALTGVRFRIVDGLSIDNVTISGIYGAGRLDMSAAALSWTPTGSPDATCTLTDPALVTDPVRDGFKLTNQDNTFFLMPQALPADACIEVEISRRDGSNSPVSGTERTIRALIGGQTWRPSTLVTYTITRDGELYVLDVAWSDLTKDYLGGTDEAFASSVKSYLTSAETNSAVAYKLQYRLPATGSTYPADAEEGWTDGTPAWLTIPSPGSDWGGSVAGETLSAIVAPQLNSSVDPHRTALQAVQHGTISAPYDLSKYNPSTGEETASSSTANSYVVNGHGYYSLPLVYGNALKSGAANAGAWSQSVMTGNSYFLTNFKNHAGNDITQPYITVDFSSQTLSAKVLWADAPDLVVNPGITGSGASACLTFEVPSANICQGNAVVALLVDGTIAWSWHIWVTDADLSQALSAFGTYLFAPVNLGWCDALEKVYPARECQLRVIQPASGKTSSPVTVKQTDKNIKSRGNGTYYQWGRKDPFAGFNSWDNDNPIAEPQEKDTYGEVRFSVNTSQAILYESIRNPSTFYATSNSFWCTEPMYNAWNAAATKTGNNALTETESTPVLKTVYDPSPVGFKVPPRIAWGSDGNLWTNNTSDTTSPESGARYTGNASLVFPFTNNRNATDGKYNANNKKHAAYWTAIRNSSYLSYRFSINQQGSFEKPVYNNSAYASYGYAIRPVMEEKTLSAEGEDIIWDDDIYMNML